MPHSADPLLPRDEYKRRLEARRSEVARYDARHRLMGDLRLAVALGAAGLAWLALGRGLLSGWWLLAPAAVFTALAVVHDGVLRGCRACQRAVDYYERALARLDHRWMGAGEPGTRYTDPAHPYADDLDLFGPGSLFELLSTARTPMGEDALAAWLRTPAAPATVLARQAAVAELRPRLDLRETLAVLGEDVRSEVHPAALAAWGEGAPVPWRRWEKPVADALAVLAVVGAVVWAVWGERDFFLAVVLVESAWFLHVRRRTDRVLAGVDMAAHDLDVLAQVLVRLEREQFASPLLAGLRSQLDIEGWPPSRRLRRLKRLVHLVESADHVLLRVVDPLLQYRVHLAFLVEAWRKQSGPAARRWLAAVGEMEALSSLAGYAYEHPADPFPEFTEGALFEGEALGHPLLPEDRTVRNDVRLGDVPRVLVVSGSNMSGKSTLLRTMGVNAVLAQAGAPVRAARLRLSPLRVGASIRVLDSLQGGSSRFYAEITRLRQIVDLAGGPVPVLFLIDEFLNGTNSHDRRIGAEAVVRGLVDRGALGLVTTHDLALAHIADVLAPRAANVHFEDHLEDGKLRFDYRLRPGVVRKSNALELMRSVGLDV